MSLDELFLRRALTLAANNLQTGDGGPFGAVVVKNDKIIGEDWNQVVVQQDPTAHAEIQAIREACRHSQSFHLEGSILYASSEPCPMCLAAAYWARISQIIYANPRSVAAMIGFCDDDLYQELDPAHGKRRLPCQHLPLPDADRPLRDWFANPGRTRY